jgi:pimeloyl-ACP methyl ester carboxylesterase
MRKVYVFSGLGADERVFKFLDWGKDNQPIYIKWIEPLRNESLKDYVFRLSSQINSPNPILVGMSFGGILAIELSKQIDTNKVILISSIKTKSELPFYYRILGFLNVPKWFPLSFFLSGNKIIYNFFGIKNRTEKMLLKNILRDTPLSFLKWALQKTANWKNTTIPPNLIHIHGGADHILPYRFVKADITIEKGGHFLIVNKAKELSRILKDILHES